MTTTIQITPSYFEAGEGKFKSTNRYLRGSAIGARFPIAKGKTMSYDMTSFYGSSSGSSLILRYSVNGYVVQESQVYYPGGHVYLYNGPFDAIVTLVKY